MKLIKVCTIFLTLWCSAQARCVMRGDCTLIGGFNKPCPVNIEAPLFISDIPDGELEELLQILEHRCPTFAYDEDGNRKPNDQIFTCCNHEQIRSMSASLELADGVLGRCPSCFRNFARQICEMNCATDQHRFVNVSTEIDQNGIEYVNEINYRVFNDFMIDAHASCAGVIVPQTGVPAINIMCGNAVTCDADAWFGFTGDTTANPLTPVQVNFIRVATEEDSMNVRAPLCHETQYEDLPCSCVDCMATCPTGSAPVIPDICTVLSVNCVGFSVGIVFFVLSSIIFIALTLLDYRVMRNMDSKPPAEGEANVNMVVKFFQSVFSIIGGFAASHPVVIIMLTTWVAFAMLFGVLNINLTSNPIELWSDEGSRSRNELDYYNSRFGPFYRAAQVFMQFDGLDPFTVGNDTYGPAFRLEAVSELIKLERDIINIGRDTGGVVLEDVCYAPLRGRVDPSHLDYCVQMSVSVYLGDLKNNITIDNYLDPIQNCINNYFGLDCLATWGGGSQPEITFGGYDDDILLADTLLINFPLSNHLLEEDLQPVLEWEQKFLELVQNYIDNSKPDFVTVFYGAERSIEDEIQRVSVAEAVPISISYILMFIYVTLALGNIKSLKTWFIDSKVMVAIGSIAVVLISIFCAMGVMGYAQITATLLAINVIPLFVLSVGVDNVFLMVNTLHDVQSNLKSYSDYNENLSFEKKERFVFEKMLRKVGPSMFVSSVTQITCFAIGVIAKFPAVVTFAAFASLSLAFLFVFQVTTVVAILSLDYKRSMQNRFDIFCCVQKKILDDENPLHSDTPYRSLTQRLMEPYSKFILNWRVKIVVALVFMLITAISIILIPQIEVGLDQEMVLPLDSYVYGYLKAVSGLMQLGPPVFFVLKSGLNFTNPEHQNVICGAQLCNDDSLITQIFLASQHSDITYLSTSSNSWLDDFIDWSGLSASCCKYNTTDGTFCPSSSTSEECTFCNIEPSDYANGQLRPHGEAFERYIPFFLQDVPTDSCNKAGLASYSGAVNYVLDSEGRATVHDTNFMAYHSALETSYDYITAVRYGYEISANITAAIQKHTGLDVEVFPYSVFYVFFEQYLNMWSDTFVSLGLCLIGAFVFNLLATGFNFLTSFAVIFTSILLVVNMMGIMYIWNIPLNAVSCVNLIVAIGIAVEFCSHIAYSFATSNRSPRDKVEHAIQEVGATIITGITLTNIPIIVLAFSVTELIEVFFFRMFFSIFVLGFLYGMVFFPVFLSYLNNITAKSSIAC